MKMYKSTKKLIGLTTLGLFVLVGAYNAVVINSESFLTSAEHTFIKTADEFKGVIIEGRKIATTSSWKKLTPSLVTAVNLDKKERLESPVAAAEAREVKPEINLSLIEVINPRKWQAGLVADSFSGSIVANNGVIESLTVSLPMNESIAVSFAELNGNTFEYELNGEKFSGLMYQVDQNGYMVSLTNGPLEGTRLRFSGEAKALGHNEIESQLAENNIEVGNFGQEASVEISPEAAVQNDQNLQETTTAQNFNLEPNV